MGLSLTLGHLRAWLPDSSSPQQSKTATHCAFSRSPLTTSLAIHRQALLHRRLPNALRFLFQVAHISQGPVTRQGRPMHHERQSGTALSVVGEEKAWHDCLWFPPAVTIRNMVWWATKELEWTKVARFGLCRIYLELRKFSNSTVFKQCSDEKKTSIKVKRKLVIFLLSFWNFNWKLFLLRHYFQIFFSRRNVQH